MRHHPARLLTPALVFCAAIASLGLSPTSASAQAIVQNDSFQDSQSARIATAELIQGEMYAASFDIPQSWLPIELLGVRVVMVAGMGAAPHCGRFSIEVFEESSALPSAPAGCFLFNAKDPGNTIYSMSQQFINNPIGFDVNADPNNYQDLLFSSINNNPSLMATIPPVMLNTSRVRVGVKALDKQCGLQQGNSFPLMLTDTDGEATYGSNFVYGYPKGICSPPSEFYLWNDFAPFFSVTPGDFVMRLILNRNTGGPDPDLDMGVVVLDMAPDGSMDMMAFEDMSPALDMMPPADMRPAFDMRPADVFDLGQSGMVDPDMKGAVSEDMGSGTSPGNNTAGNSSAAGALEVSSVSPSQLVAGTAAEVAILGGGFESGLEVTLNARKIGVIETKAQRILASVPADLAPGAYDVIVTNPDGASALLAMGLNVTDADAPAPDANNMDGMGEQEGGGNEQDPGRVESPDAGCGCAQRGRAPAGSLGLAALVFGVFGLRRRRD